MQIQLDWDGRTWAVDTENVTIAQAFVIKETTKDESWPAGRGLKRWLLGVDEGEPGCLRALYWLMLAQDGQQVAAAGLEFAAMRYHSAWVLAAATAQATAEQLRLIIAEAEQQLIPLRKALAVAEAAETAAEPEGPTPRPDTGSHP
jgi:hypothetical protein